MVPVPGGVLVRDSRGRLIGAVGISGDKSDADEAAAIAGIEAAGLGWSPIRDKPLRRRRTACRVG